MEITDDRNAEDVEFANHEGRIIADTVLAPRVGVFALFRPRPKARAVVSAALADVTRYQEYRTSQRVPKWVQSRLQERYEAPVENLIRTISLSRALDGVPILTPSPGRFEGRTLVDLFHTRTIDSLMRQSRADGAVDGAWPAHPPGSKAWSATIKNVLPGLDNVTLVDERAAGRGLMTSLLFAFRGFMKTREEVSESVVECDTDYTVKCTDGYVLEVFEECRFAPIVFGDRKSSPVTDRLECGYYRFQATNQDGLIISRGTHEVSPRKRSTILTDV